MICPNCGDEFTPNHGNRDYCCYECQRTFNNNKQRENNAIVKTLSKGFLDNYKLFQRLLPATGRVQVRIMQLMKTGFDQDAFYRTQVDKERVHWHQVNEYFFTVIKKSNGELILDLFKR